MAVRQERRVVNKTANFTIDPYKDKPGTVFTNSGASGSVLGTLPAASQALKGWWYRFKCRTAQAFGPASAAVDTLVALSDATADSVTVPTIGGEIEAFCDGTSWYASGIAVGHTYTVNT
jgi:hypothetical protein